MRRTYVMHTRDNRRPHYYAQQGQTQQGPCLSWKKNDGAYWMMLDERAVAKVMPLDDHGFDAWGCPTYHRHDAILLVGSTDTRKAFDDLDSAKAWCENQFAKGIT